MMEEFLRVSTKLTGLRNTRKEVRMNTHVLSPIYCPPQLRVTDNLLLLSGPSYFVGPVVRQHVILK